MSTPLTGMSTPSTEMSTSSFHCFPLLPAELRFQIWEAAFSAPNVWVAIPQVPPDDDGGDDLRTDTPVEFTMILAFPAPARAALACKEAWRLLRSGSGELVRGPARSPGKIRPFWVDLRHTIVHLGNPIHTSDLVANFDADVLSKFEHVAWDWHLSHKLSFYRSDRSGFASLARACQRLSVTCPGLRTIIIQGCEDDRPSHTTLEEVAGYAAILEYTGPQLGWERVDHHYFRDKLLAHFGPSPPRVHFLAPDSRWRLP